MAHYRSFLFPEAELRGDSIILDKRESHHLVKVFRAREGDSIEVLDGRGRRYRGTLTRADAKGAGITIDQTLEAAEPKHHVTLLQALPKGKAMDLVLRTATEIGASEVQPVYTKQSEVRIPEDRLSGKVEKWRSTTIEASKQCGLPFLPRISAPLGLGEWLDRNPQNAGDLRLVASLESGSRLLLDALRASDLKKQIVVAVGPEGDFSNDEYAHLREEGFMPVRFGDNVLRAETAAGYVLSVIDQFTRLEGPLGQFEGK